MSGRGGPIDGKIKIYPGRLIITDSRKIKQEPLVVCAEDRERRNRRRGDLVDFFARSPLREESLAIERVTDYPREIEL